MTDDADLCDASLRDWERWEKHEDSFLRSRWDRMTAEQLAHALGRSKAAVYSRSRKLGLKVKPGRRIFAGPECTHVPKPNSEIAERYREARLGRFPYWDSPAQEQYECLGGIEEIEDDLDED